VDAITGATITSNAVLKALSTALGLDAPAVEEAVTGATAVSGATATSEEAEPTAAPETEEAVTGATATSEEPAATEEPAVTETPATEKPTATEAPAATEKAAATEKPAEKSAAAEPALIGSYLAVKETNFSIIRVIVTTENGKITGCRILSEAKSEGSDFLTDQIREDWAKAIVKSGSAETDAITGATLQFSAGAVQEAVKEILEKAAGK